MRVFEMKMGKELANFESTGKYPFGTPQFSPDSSLLAATDYGDGVTVWDITEKKIVQTQRFQEIYLYHLAFSPDSKTLAVHGQAKFDANGEREPDPRDLPQPNIYHFDTKDSNKKPDILACPHGWRGPLVFSPDGKTLAAGGAGAVHLFDMKKK
jgi:WD40 repeat protein